MSAAPGADVVPGLPLGGAGSARVGGAAFVLLGVAILWSYERRLAVVEAFATRAFSTLMRQRAAACGKDDPVAPGSLVHVQGNLAKSAGPVCDRRFDITLEDNCLRLRTEVEVFRWVEHQPPSAPLGARLQRALCCCRGKLPAAEAIWWAQEWCSTRGELAAKKDGTDGSLLGVEVVDCDYAEYGDGLRLPRALVAQCKGFRDASERLGEVVRSRDGGLAFWRHPDGAFYHRPGSAGDLAVHEAADRPQVGDLRVRFTIVPDSEVTVLAGVEEHPGEAPGVLTFRPCRWTDQGLLPKGTARGVAEDPRRRRSACRCLPEPELFVCVEGSKDAAACIALGLSAFRSPQQRSGPPLLGYALLVLGLQLLAWSAGGGLRAPASAAASALAIAATIRLLAAYVARCAQEWRVVSEYLRCAALSLAVPVYAVLVQQSAPLDAGRALLVQAQPPCGQR